MFAFTTEVVVKEIKNSISKVDNAHNVRAGLQCIKSPLAVNHLVTTLLDENGNEVRALVSEWATQQLVKVFGREFVRLATNYSANMPVRNGAFGG